MAGEKLEAVLQQKFDGVMEALAVINESINSAALSPHQQADKQLGELKQRQLAGQQLQLRPVNSAAKPAPGFCLIT